MAPTPLFHVTANNCLLHPATISGSKLVLTYKWDATRALELIEREGVTNFSGVPTMSREMLMHPDWDIRNTSTLVGLGGGGAPLQPDLVEKIDQSQEGTAPSTGYGLTETHGIVTASSGKPVRRKARIVRSNCANTRRQADRRDRQRRAEQWCRRALCARLGRHQGLSQSSGGNR